MKHEKVRVVQKVALEVGVVVTKPILNCSLVLFFVLFSITSNAAVLPEERTDIFFHSYSGGGMDISGPAVLVRKSVSDSVSLSARHYVDTISSASIDVEVILGASRYDEERIENAFSIDFLNEKTLMNLSYTNSNENDFVADTFSFGMSQDVFGDLTTVSMGYTHGSNEIGKTGTASFSEASQTDKFKLSLTQVLTKNLVAAASLEVITDAGFLNNPYRKVRYLNTPITFLLEDEIYPKTRTSNAVAVRARYFLPYRAALHAEYRMFQDSWGIVANNFEIGYIHPFADNWTADVHFRSYAQTKATFYSDLFPYSNAQNFLARDKELSTFNNNTIGFGISFEFAKGEGGFIDKASVNFKFDYINFNYKDFRDATQISFTPGNEPLYKFSANVMQLFVSVWF